MREIKFRAWIKKENKYLYWFEMYGLSRYLDNKLGVHVGISDQCYLDPEDIILEQFTGLIDKNGKDIYEGDIVQHVLGLAKIEFQYGEFRIIGIKEDIYDRMYHELIDATIPNMEGSRFDGITTRLEIVGNIHE